MRTVLFISAVLFTVGTLSSCGSGVHNDKISKLDSLQTELKKKLKLLESADIQNAAKAKKESENQLAFINSNYPDTMSAELAGRLSDYKMNRKLIKTIFERTEGIKTDINHSINQLKDLKQDLRNDLLSEEDAQEYYRQEVTAAKMLLQRLNYLEEKLPHAIEQHNELKPTADSVIKELNRRGIR